MFDLRFSAFLYMGRYIIPETRTNANSVSRSRRRRDFSFDPSSLRQSMMQKQYRETGSKWNHQAELKISKACRNNPHQPRKGGPSQAGESKDQRSNSRGSQAEHLRQYRNRDRKDRRQSQPRQARARPDLRHHLCGDKNENAESGKNEPV